jgi:deoxyribodipyrimidine photo-lyase
VVPPGELRPVGGDHYKVFTPYWRAWRHARWRQPLPAPHTVRLPPGVRVGELPVPSGAVSPCLQAGGETAGWQRARAWLDGPLSRYGPSRDDLAGDQTSRRQFVQTEPGPAWPPRPGPTVTRRGYSRG